MNKQSCDWLGMMPALNNAIKVICFSRDSIKWWWDNKLFIWRKKMDSSLISYTQINLIWINKLKLRVQKWILTVNCFSAGWQDNSLVKAVFRTNVPETTGYPHMLMWRWTPNSHHTQRLTQNVTKTKCKGKIIKLS